jgi:hypothetical protein
MTEAAKQSGIALENAYQFMLWLMPKVEKFPRSQKFLLGDRLQGAALDILEGLKRRGSGAVYTGDVVDADFTASTGIVI